MATGLTQHWNGAYASGDQNLSWFQSEPRQSLQMFDAAGVAVHDAVVDVGGGASTLVDALLRRGFSEVSVLDCSADGMRLAQDRLGEELSGRVEWVVADVLLWNPSRRFQVWHDRAVFHFQTTDRARGAYVQVLNAATLPGAIAVFGCFAADGPRQCSGLPAARYDAVELAACLGAQWRLIAEAREEHVTPSGAVQPFMWAAFSRQR